MKKRRLVCLVVFVMLIATALFGAVACGDDGHTHNYGDWTIVTQPTLEAQGKASHKCSEDGYEETVSIPSLNDSEVWTKSTTKTPTHTENGVDTYTSEYGSVEIETPKTAEHVWGEWTITQKPTLTAGGKASHSCTLGDGASDEIDIPALNDSEVWTKSTTKSPTHTAKGLDSYTSEYGVVEVETAALADHTWGEWTITQEPTLTAGGKAQRSCTANDGATDETDIPALNDSEIWTKSEKTPATHLTGGVDSYTSEYGVVDVDTPVKSEDHVWSAWSWKNGVEPTESAGATAQHSCTVDGCNETEEVPVPALSEGDVWSVTAEQQSTYNAAGSKTYHSEYGDVTVTVAKKVAPYDNKTYHSFVIDSNENFKPRALSGDGGSWTAAELTLDENGTGLGHAMPFSNNTKIVFKMIDEATGEIEVSFQSKAEGDGEDEFTGSIETAKGYVDFATGVVIMAYDGTNLSYAHILTPFGTYEKYSAKISIWGESQINYSIACSWTYGEEQTLNIYIHNDVAHFGVSFVNLQGESVEGDACYNAAQLYVKKGGETLEAVGYDGEAMKPLDGFEGVYECALLGQITLSGVGTLTLTDGTEGTYKVEEGSTLTLLINKDGGMKSYNADVTRDGMTITATEVKVTVSFNMNGHGTQVNAVESYKYVPMGDLPTPEAVEGQFFRGWYLEADCVNPVPVPYTPTENVEFFAKWAKKLTITVYKDGEEQASVTLDVAVGDNILNALNEAYADQLGMHDGLVFMGWYVKNGEQQVWLDTMPNEVFREGDETHPFYASWENLPFAGEYKGTEIWNETSGNSASTNLTISADGKISGSKTGTVQAYDKNTQMITWLDSGNKVNYFFFDEASGVLAWNYNGTTNAYLGTDIYVVVKGATTNKLPKAYGVKAPSRHGGDSNFYAHFITITTDEGEKAVLLYDTAIYSDITITDAFGKTLGVDGGTGEDVIRYSKTLIVKDSEGNIVLAVGSQGSSFNQVTSTDPLDSYYGKYTGDSGELAIDGAGTAKLGENTGTYKLATDGSAYTLDLYIMEGDTEVYYEATITESAYTLNKAMVSLTFNKDGVGDNETKSYNKNIEITIEPLTDPTGEYLFRGWYSDEAFEHELEKEEDSYLYTPTGEATVYAKWIKKVTLHIHYNDDSKDDLTVDTYGQGESYTVPRPVKSGSKFGGWFTDNTTFANAWGEMDENGSTTVTFAVGEVVEIHIYAKWGEAPAYSGEYKLYYFDDSTANGGVEKFSTYNTNVVIDAEGALAKTSGTAWPFNSYDMQIVGEPDETTGKFQFKYSNGTFNAQFDPEKKIISFIARGGDYGDMFLLVPVDYAADATVTDSYWGNGGDTRAISIEKDGETYSVFLRGAEAYFGVTFTNRSGATVLAQDAYNSDNVYIKKGDETIVGYAFNGTKLVELDGYEGTYTYAGVDDEELNLGDIEINGAGKLTSEKGQGVYTLVEGKSYTAELRINGLFYYLTLTLNKDNNTYTIEKPMATVTYVLDGIPQDVQTSFPENGNYNLNTQFTLEVPEVEGYVFRGWYTEQGDWYDSQKLDQDENGNYVFTPTEMAVTLYAHMLKEVTLTLHYGNGMEDVQIKLGVGEAVGNIKPSPMPKDPVVVNGKRFLGWYKDEEFAEKWEDTYVVNQDQTVYAQWKEIGEVDYTTEEGTSGWIQLDDGSWKSNNYKASSTTAKLEILFSASGKFSFHWTCGSEGERWDYLKIVWNKADGTSETLITEKGGKTLQQGDISIEVAIGDTLVLTYQKDGSTDTDPDCATISKIVWVKDVFDEWGGTYKGNKTNEETQAQDLVFNGKGGATWAGRVGTYAVKEGNVFEVTLEADGDKPAEYWLVTINTDASSYTAEMPTVTVNFVTGDDGITVESQTYNIKIPVALPDADAETKYVEGWYTDGSYETAVTLNEDGLYVPEGSGTVTLYGKVVDKLTLTLNYNGHGPQENKTLYVRKGDTPDLSAEAPEDDTLYFTGWYEEAGCENAYTPAPLEESKTVYAGWTDQEYAVEIVDNEWTETSGVYRSTKTSTNHCNILAITFKASGTFTFSWSVSFSDTYDGLNVALNYNPPHQASSKVKTEGSKGTQNVTVKAGDVLYIGAYWDSSDDSPTDFAEVSNFSFVAG